MIEENDVIDYATEIFNTIAKHDLDVTFFDVVTMLAFMHFREQKVDYGVLEVGLGGRCDGTNIVTDVECAAITSIGRDHEDTLGYDLKDIAFEKAGIIKEGVRNLVLGPTARIHPIFQLKYDMLQSKVGDIVEVTCEDDGLDTTDINNNMTKEILKIILGP